MNKLLELTVALVIIGASLAFGGVQPLTYSLVEVVLFAALFMLLLRQTWEGKVSLTVPVWTALFSLLCILQLVPLPSQLIVTLAPARQLATGLTKLSDDQWTWTTLSISSHDTLLALGKFLAYFSAFLLTVYLFDSRKRKSTIIRALIFLGCFEAVYGIIQFLTGWQKIFTYAKQFDLEEATGTYINRNHFAGLLEMITPFILALAFYFFQQGERKNPGFGTKEASRGISPSGFQTLFYFFLAVILMLALVFSRSRGGILASVFSLIFMALLAQLKIRRKSWTVGVFLVLLAMIGYGLWIGLDPVLERFEQIRQPGYLQLTGRVAIWKDTLRLVRDHPMAGTGLGTFGVAFRHYQTDLVNSFADHTHNDYLEFAADTGLPGAALLFLPILYLFIRMIIRFLDDSRRYRRAVTLGCIGSTAALLIHSATDFNLQVPANALVFSVILGIGYKAACLEPRQDSNDAVSG